MEKGRGVSKRLLAKRNDKKRGRESEKNYKALESSRCLLPRIKKDVHQQANKQANQQAIDDLIYNVKNVKQVKKKRLVQRDDNRNVSSLQIIYSITKFHMCGCVMAIPS
jgi:hypothetical protein